MEIDVVSKPLDDQELKPLADLTHDRCRGCSPTVAEELRLLAEHLADLGPPSMVVYPTGVQRCDIAAEPVPQEAVTS